MRPALAQFLIGLALMLPCAALRGWVLSILWGWFVVPLGMPSITLAQAVGVSVVVGFLTYKVSRSDIEDEPTAKAISRMVASGVFLPLFALACGWLYLQVFF